MLSKRPLIAVLLILALLFSATPALALDPIVIKPPLNPDLPVLTIPLATGISVNKASLGYKGGSVTFNVTGINLLEADSLGVYLTGAVTPTTVPSDIWTDTNALASFSLPANSSTDPLVFTAYPVINGAVANSLSTTVTVSGKPEATGIAASPVTLPKGGGTVVFTITGVNLKQIETIAVNADHIMSITDGNTQVTSNTKHMISMDFPDNPSFMAKTYTIYPYIDGVEQSVSVQVTVPGSLMVPPLTLTTVTAFTADKTALPAAGGTVKFTLTGTNLDKASALEVKGTGGFSANVSVESATSGTALVMIPANTTASQKTFVFNPVVNGTAQTLSVNVSVAPAAAGPAAGSMANFLPKNSYQRGMFTDVDETLWYGLDKQQVIATAYEYGLMKGNSDGSFNVKGNVTLAEAVAMAARVHKIYFTGADDFVQGSPWYQVYVDYAVANGIIRADDFSSYAKAASRAQMAYIFAGSLPEAELAIKNTVMKLPDVSLATGYQPEIFQLYRAGVLAGGDTAGTFKPLDPISRAEAAAIISRVALSGLRFSGRVYQ